MHVYTLFHKKLDPLLFHIIFTKTNCTEMPKSTQEVMVTVNIEYVHDSLTILCSHRTKSSAKQQVNEHKIIINSKHQLQHNKINNH